MANFRDVLTDPKANALFSDFVARKIRQRVKDPAVAETLIPKCHGFGTRRVPQETRFYEAFNLPHVRLVDTRETPIERVTETGIRPATRSYEFDIIIYATGFDAITGAFDRIEFRGVGGAAAEGPLGGGAEDLSRPDVGGLPQHADDRRAAQRLHPLQHPALHRAERGLGHRADAPRAGPRHHAVRGDAGGRSRLVARISRSWPSGMLYTQVDSWATGINRNVEGKNVRRILQYQGGAPAVPRALRRGRRGGLCGHGTRPGFRQDLNGGAAGPSLSSARNAWEEKR